MSDCFGYLRWSPTSCQRCGYERADCNCVGGFAESTIEEIALAIWREREIGFPPRVRRFSPDAIDRESGAWQAVVREAHRRAIRRTVRR
jgi:hypothetical protein